MRRKIEVYFRLEKGWEGDELGVYIGFLVGGGKLVDEEEVFGG